MHAAIDVIFRRNHIHHCTRGIWLDWQAQGTRVTQNLFHHNTLPTLSEDPDKEEFLGIGDDIFVEVSHGPTLIDNNILLSTRSLKLAAQGIAVVHNLIGGALTCVGRGTDNGAKTLSSSRYTPYHVAHRTEVMGFMTFLHGDMRFYNNIFVQQDVHPALVKMCEFAKEHYNEWDDNNVEVGTFKYNASRSGTSSLRATAAWVPSPATATTATCPCGARAMSTLAAPSPGIRKRTPRWCPRRSP